MASKSHDDILKSMDMVSIALRSKRGKAALKSQIKDMRKGLYAQMEA